MEVKRAAYWWAKKSTPDAKKRAEDMSDQELNEFAKHLPSVPEISIKYFIHYS